MKLEMELKRLYEAAKKDRGGVRRWENDFKQAFRDGQLAPNSLRLSNLFEALVPHGRELRANWQASGGGYVQPLQEEVGGINLSAFGFITGQMIFTTIMDQWKAPDFIGDQLVTTIPSTLMQESMPGVSRTGDVSEALAPLAEFPMVSMSEEVSRFPVTQKRGQQVAISREMVAFERTGQVLKQAADLAHDMRLNKEKRILDMVFGIVNPYVYNDVASNTYLASGAYVNLISSNALVDWTDIDNAEQKFAEMTDPMTGELVATTPSTLIVPSKLKHTARQILTATTLRTGTDSLANQRYSNNTLDDYAVLSSPYVKQRTASDTTWAFGDPKRAFVYVENFPITVEARPLGDSSFTHDVVAGWKVFEMGTVGVAQPRHMTLNTAG